MSKYKNFAMDMLSGLQIIIFMITCTSLKQNVQGSVLKTDTVPNKCVVQINSTDTFKDIGESWSTNDTCVIHSCEVDDHGIPFEKLVHEVCNLNCENEYEVNFIPGKCCGECVKTKCEYEGKLYNIGDIWKGPNKCFIQECAQNNSEAFITTYKKSCPKIDSNCPKSNIYEKDCCMYCKENDEALIKNSVLFNNANDVEDLKDYKTHPCRRKCLSNNEPMNCYYEFEVEWYETLSKACYNCPYNLTDCYRPHCITGDGARRSVLVVNRMMPGPSIEVCQNDIIIVDVVNHLLGESTTIHWHGMQQKSSPFMDGVPHVSQCPIQPHTTFRYTFKAEHVGTHFWHSHTGMQRGDGCFGALIVRQPYSEDPHANVYDFDLSEHIILLQDWGHISGVPMFSSHHHSVGDNKPPNILVNGYGRFYNFKLKDENKTKNQTTFLSPLPQKENDVIENQKFLEKVSNNTNNSIKFQEEKLSNTTNTAITRHKRSIIENPLIFPLKTFTVQKGSNYRFRVINAEFLNCPIAISIDNHTLVVINSDGFDLEPIEVNSLVTYAGERFDFILKANQKIDNYWIRFKGLMDCDERFTSAHQAAILHYENSSNDEPQSDIPPTYHYNVTGLELNPLNKGPDQVDSLVLSELKSLHNDDDWNSEIPDYKFYVYYDFYPKDNPHFHLSNLYGFNQVNSSKLFTPQLNHISLKMPSAPLMVSRDQIDDSLFCNESSLANQGINCRNDFCECHHVLQVPLGSVVEMVIVDEGRTYDANHPFHLHGYSFRVIGMDRLKSTITIEEIKKLDKEGKLRRNLKKAPLKDTVTIPDGGYTIIRFKADNPGYWLFHCHIEFHAEIGMALLFKVGSHDQMAPVPKDFPKCSNYMPVLNKKYTSSFSIRIIPNNLILIFSIFSTINLLILR